MYQSAFLIYITVLWLFVSVSALADMQRFKTPSLAAGLSQSYVQSIAQDKQGFLWLGTQDGLNRYDGYQFDVFHHHPEQPGSLSHNDILSLYADEQGYLWVGTKGGGLNRFDPATQRFTIWRMTNNRYSLSSDVIQTIQADDEGYLWLGTDKGLNRFDPETGQAVVYRHAADNPYSISHDDVRGLYLGANGHWWIATFGGGLNYFDPVSRRFTHYTPLNSSNNLWAVYEDTRQQVWIGTRGSGLQRFDPKLEKFTAYPEAGDETWAIAPATPDALWIGSASQGLYQINLDGVVLQHDLPDERRDDSLGGQSILSLYPDADGGLWIGTQGGGVSYTNPLMSQFQVVYRDREHPGSLSHNDVWAMAEDSQQTLWVGTSEGLNRRAAGETDFRIYRHSPTDEHSLADSNIKALLVDSKNVLWVGTRSGGLSRYRPETDDFLNYSPEALQHPDVRDLLMDHNGILWIATLGGGLHKFDPENQTFQHIQGSPTDSFVLYEDSEQRLWVGSLGEGLGLFDRQSGTFHYYRHDSNNPYSLSHNDVVSLYEDHDGTLWVGTSDGLNKWISKTGNFRHYFDQPGLPSALIYGILEDRQGYLWLSTNQGLSRFDPRSQQFRHHGVGEGLQSNEFNAGPALHGADGRLYFGGINGFNVFDPQRIRRNELIPPVVLTDFQIFNRSVSIGEGSPLQKHISLTKKLVLSWQQRFFSFEFKALSFLMSEKNQYAYQLEGFDEDWQQVGTRQEAYYTNVPPGDYIFKVRAANNSGVWNESGIALSITIVPPFWRTTWAYTLYVLTVLAAIFAGLYWQQQRLFAKQRELERERDIAERLEQANQKLLAADRMKDEFLANTSHELRTPLHGIIGLAESLIDGATGPLSDGTKENLYMLVNSGRRLSSLVDRILDFARLRQQHTMLNTGAVNLHQVVNTVLAMNQPLIGDKPLVLDNAVPADLPFVAADEDALQQILYNLIGNAIKFTERGSICISAFPVEQVSEMNPQPGIAVSVTDSGIGIAREHHERIFEAFEQVEEANVRSHGGTGLGLALTRQLVLQHGGKIQVKSQVGIGTQMIFTLLFFDSSVAGKFTFWSESGSEASISADLPPEYKEKLPSSSDSSDIPPPLIVEETSEQPLFELRSTVSANDTILIVDDEPVNRQVLVNHLSLFDYRIEQASTGQEALDLLASGLRPDLILLDVMMPKLSGYDVTRIMRQQFAPNEMPIVLLTARNQVDDRVKGLEAGANDYLTKPVDKRELLARIQTHLTLHHLEQQLRKALTEAVQANNAKNQFLATMSHELRTPLNAILGYCSLLEEDLSDMGEEEMVEDAKQIDLAGRHLLKLINDTLDIVHIETGHIEIVPETANLPDLLQKATSMIKPQMSENGNTLVVRADTDLPNLYTDQDKLFRSLLGLLDNAAKFTSDGTITLTIKLLQSNGENWLQMTITDTGIGIDTGKQAMLFDIFTQADSSTTRRYGGIGLGLALTYRFVALLGGTLTMNSTPGEGSTFIITIPQHLPDTVNTVISA